MYSLFMVLFTGFILIGSYSYSNEMGYIENSEEIEYTVDAKELRLVSGRLYLNCGNGLIHLTRVRYEDESVIVSPKAVLKYCYKCGQIIILGVPHQCNGGRA